LHAFLLMYADFPDAVLVVAGAGEAQYEAQLKTLAENLGISGKVLFVGFLTGDKMTSVLRHAYLYVLPSYSEGLPLSVQNALTCGAPVVISDACNMPEVAEYGAGVVLPTNFKPRDLADALTRVLNNSHERDAMAQQTTRLVAERYSLEAVGRRTASFCESLL
jgi:glycosyltransferase involved in cell wall biosynthesis